jgi:D-alanine-D-alanine ligase
MARLAIGLVYDLLGTHPHTPDGPPDVDVEYEPEQTVDALEAAVRALGHTPVRLGAPHELLSRIGRAELPALDAAWNIAEGRGARNREAWAPVLLEMAGVPALGSDALTLSATLDKAWARTLVASAGVGVPHGGSAASVTEAEVIAKSCGYPVFVKPRWEGTAKGIGPHSRVEGPADLAAAVEAIVETYGQPALVEHFVAGPEYTVTVIGHAPPRALPVLQRALEVESRIGVHALEAHAPPGGWQTESPGALDDALESELSRLALRAHQALECLDFSRSDFRLDAKGRPQFLEINPLPTFAPDGSFGILAELAGRPVEGLLAEVLEQGLIRLGLA